MFTLVADIADPSVTIGVTEAVPAAFLPFRQRELMIPPFLPRMSRLIRRYQPDLVHQHAATWSWPAAAAAARNRVPLLTTLHGADVFMALRPPNKNMQRWHHRNIDIARSSSSRVLAVSRWLASEAVRAGFDSSRLEVHYQGIDTDFFTPSSSGTKLAEPPTIAFVGSLSDRKGIRDLIQASRQLIGSVEHHLVIVGAGPLERELKAQTSGDGHIQFLGPIDQVAIRKQLRAATVMVAPSHEFNGWREAAGLVLLEAQACGTPVIAYDCGGISEMLDPGVSGLLVPERDLSGLSAAMHDVLTLESSSYLRMRHEARRFVEAERSLRRSCTALEQHYEDVTSTGPLQVTVR